MKILNKLGFLSKIDCSIRYTGSSFNVNYGRFTKAVQGSHYMSNPKLDAANKAYRKQN